MSKERLTFKDHKENVQNISIKTLLSILKQDKDQELCSIAKQELAERYGSIVLDIIEMAINAKDEKTSQEHMEALKDVSGISFDTSSMLVKEILAVRQQKSLPMSAIMDMYHSENDFLINKAKEYAVMNYEQYIYSIMHQYYPSYVDKYFEELYQCGVIGILNALKKYDEEKGKFTTYSRVFIIHEMEAQINFNHNDTSVHYNNIQKKIKNAIKDIEEQNCEVSIAAISMMTELKPEVVKREMEYMERTKFVYIDSESEIEQIHDYRESPEELSIINENSKALQEALESLPQEMKEIVWKKFVLEMNNEEIAAQYNTTVGKIKTIFQRGIKQIKEEPKIRYTFSDRLSEAEREMLKYTSFIKPTMKNVEERLEETMAIMNSLAAEMRRNTLENFNESSECDEKKMV